MVSTGRGNGLPGAVSLAGTCSGVAPNAPRRAREEAGKARKKANPCPHIRQEDSLVEGTLVNKSRGDPDLD